VKDHRFALYERDIDSAPVMAQRVFLLDPTLSRSIPLEHHQEA
jgi:hypothetical protein